jgi:phage gp45-like
MRSTVRDAAHRAYLGLTRGLLKKAQDNHFWQEVNVRMFAGESKKGVERVQQYGYTSVPLPQKDDKDQHTAEAIIGFLGGNRAHAVVLAIDDRRHRLKNMKEGEVALYDDQGQRVHIKRSTVSIESPMTITHRIVVPQQDEAGAQQGSQQGGQGGKQSGQQQSASQKAGTKQDAQTTRQDRTRITQGTDHITFEVLDGSGATKTSIRMDASGITSKGDTLTDLAKKDIVQQADNNMKVTVDNNYTVNSQTAILSADLAKGWLD